MDNAKKDSTSTISHCRIFGWHLAYGTTTLLNSCFFTFCWPKTGQDSRSIISWWAWHHQKSPVEGHSQTVILALYSTILKNGWKAWNQYHTDEKLSQIWKRKQILERTAYFTNHPKASRCIRSGLKYMIGHELQHRQWKLWFTLPSPIWGFSLFLQ